jgi:ubiquitin-conjugating enzyme E2 Q
MQSGHSRQTIQRVQQELVLTKKHVEINEKFVIETGDDLMKWCVRMPSASFLEMAPSIYFGLEENAQLYSHRKAEVVLEISFSPTYPQSPPFVRVLSPRFDFHTGHVTIGGSVCAPFLTLKDGVDGWNSTWTMAAVILMLHMMLMTAEPMAKVVNTATCHHPNPSQNYSEEEAKIAFARVARDHGWKV